MNLSQLIEVATKWLLWGGIALGCLTLLGFLLNWNIKFRFVGATIFTFLLSGSCYAFSESYSPPYSVEGAKYAPVVYDNGSDLVVAQVPDDFPKESIEPTLKQIAGNLKGGGRNGSKTHVRLRKVIDSGPGINQPIIIGEAIRDMKTNQTLEIETLINTELTPSDKTDIASTPINEPIEEGAILK